MANALPATERELMDQLVTERWHMLTMDTEVDSTTGDGYSIAGKSWDILTDQLAYIASRLAGDGWEGEPETHDVVVELMETIGNRLVAFGVEHRLKNASPVVKAVAS